MNKLLFVAVLVGLLLCSAAAFGQDQQQPFRRRPSSRGMVSRSSLLNGMESNLKRVFEMIQQLRGRSRNSSSDEPRRRPSRRPRSPMNSDMEQQSNEGARRSLRRQQSQRRPRKQVAQRHTSAPTQRRIRRPRGDSNSSTRPRRQHEQQEEQQQEIRRRRPSTRREQQEEKPKKRRTQQNQSSTSVNTNTLKLMDWAIKKFTKKGIPYKAFAPYNEKSGYSCSAFTKEVAKEAGINLAAFSPLQFKTGQKVVSKSDLQTGDLIFWRFPTDKEWLKRAEGVPNHVGFYLGNGMILHSSGGKGPNVMKMTPAYERFYIGARRIFNSQSTPTSSQESNSESPRTRRPSKKVAQRPAASASTQSRVRRATSSRRSSQLSNDSSSTMSPRDLMNWAIKKYTGKGIPYKSSPPYNEKVGFGCSPFTSTVAKKVGITLPAYSPSQFQMGKKISWNDMQVGDLIFWRFPTTQSWLKRPPGVPNHVGFYLGNGKILHSSGGRGPNVMTMTSSYKQYFIGARRILPQ